MASELELAAFAENVYRPSEENRIEVPGWTRDDNVAGANRGFGFDAAVFSKNDNSEIVIAFRGTDFGNDLVLPLVGMQVSAEIIQGSARVSALAGAACGQRSGHGALT